MTSIVKLRHLKTACKRFFRVNKGMGDHQIRRFFKYWKVFQQPLMYLSDRWLVICGLLLALGSMQGCSRLVENPTIYKFSKGQQTFYVIGERHGNTAPVQLGLLPKLVLVSVGSALSVEMLEWQLDAKLLNTPNQLIEKKFIDENLLKQNQLDIATIGGVSSSNEALLGIEARNYFELLLKIVGRYESQLLDTNFFSGRSSANAPSELLYRAFSGNHKRIHVLDDPSERYDLWKDCLQGKDFNQTLKEAIRDIKTQDYINDIADRFDQIIASGETERATELMERYKHMRLLYDCSIVERNKKWTIKINSLLNDEERLVVVVGFMHLIGADGLISIFENQGFRTTKIHSIWSL
jgi:hypothetical protein